MEEMSVENLLFWLECEEYQEIKAPEYRAFSARKIHRKYIADNAPTMLGIEDRLRKAIVVSSAPGPDLFAEAQAATVIAMKLDIFPRFLDSVHYRELVDLKYEDRKVASMEHFDLYRFQTRFELITRLTNETVGINSHRQHFG